MCIRVMSVRDIIMANLRKLGVAMLVYSVPQYVAEDKHRGYNTTHLIKVPQSHHR